MRRIFIAAILSAGFTLTIISPASAQQSYLEQQIKPIECVYTKTYAGSRATYDSRCENQIVPVVTGIDIRNERLVLTGEYDQSAMLSLRIWLNGRWFTLGIDSRLTASGGVWRLDLSQSGERLPEGEYIIAIEEETTDGLLLRNVFAASFVVEHEQPPAEPDHTVDQPSLAEPDRSLISLPLVTISPQNPLNPDSVWGWHTKPNITWPSQIDSQESPSDNATIVGVGAIVVLAVSALVMSFIFRFWRRK